MDIAPRRPALLAEARAYLCVDAFMVDMAGATALSTAFETGVVDHLAAHPSCRVGDLQNALKLDARGLQFLLGLLRAHGVLGTGTGTADALDLTPAFRAALGFRDILEAKLYFAKLVAPDFIQLLTALLMEPARFAEHARIFKLFSYQHALVSTLDNLAQTARWMRLTTALTTCEAAACMAVHDFSGYRRMLDVGGNSGEFALRLCRAHHALEATVYDLPVVCDIGAAHVAEAGEGSRIRFVRRDPAQTALPGGQDLVTFKSMLHDWPDAEMADFLRRAREALAPGGTLLIFERRQLPDGPGALPLPYGQVPLMLFFRSYRTPQAYCAQLSALGFEAISVSEVLLDMPFILITARRP